MSQLKEQLNELRAILAEHKRVAPNPTDFATQLERKSMENEEARLVQQIAQEEATSQSTFRAVLVEPGQEPREIEYDASARTMIALLGKGDLVTSLVKGDHAGPGLYLLRRVVNPMSEKPEDDLPANRWVDGVLICGAFLVVCLTNTMPRSVPSGAKTLSMTEDQVKWALEHFRTM